MRLHPFHALRPRPELAARVASVPYDVVDRREAAALAEGNPESFLHVARSDIDLPPDTDPHDRTIYAAARAALERLVSQDVLRRDAEAALFLYRQIMGGRAQTGVVGCVHIDDYERDVIRKHERTRRDKEDDRTRHVLTLGANAEPVLLTYRAAAAVDALVERDAAGAPLYDFTAPDGVRHTVWRVADPGEYVEAFARVPVGYVADGHHRSASAWRAGRERRAADPRKRDDAEYNWFLAVLFPADQLRILPYNRLVKDLNGLSPAGFRSRLAALGCLEPRAGPGPPAPGSFCFFLDGGWDRLTLDPGSVNRDDPVASLDASLLQERVLAPILGIADPRSDPRLDFVGGIRGTAELERRVRSGEMALAVSLHPATVEQLMAVADAGEIMPPKSTWFEPKLRSGLFVHTLD
jgi:uncharacterized protein (DUF1015 family)